MRKLVLDALAAALDAVGTADFYRLFGDYLRECIDFDNIIVVIYNGQEKPHIAHSRVHGPNVFRHVEEQYLSGAYLLDPVYHFHLKRGAPGLYRLLDIAPDQFRSSRYFKWYYGRIGITDEISAFLPVDDDMTITISMGKDTSSGTVFSPKAELGLREHEAVILAVLRRHWHTLDVAGNQIAPSTSLTENIRRELQTHHGIDISARQAEVAFLILQGHSSPSIGLQLGISAQTVKVFRKQLYTRCGISSQAELFTLLMPMLGKVNPIKA